MQAQQAILTFSEAERPLGDRLLKIAIEIDRVEGYSEPHAIAIARMVEKIGARMGLHGVDLTALKFAALAHDVGERAMKRNYLLRPSVLSWEETLDLWRHPILGEQAAGELKLSRQTQLLIRWHHEWWNGGGYPDGLAGEAIPLGARVLRAVDTYFALNSNRPHRQRFERLEAEQMIADMAGIEFDPQVARLLLQILAEERADEAEFAYSEAETGVVFSESELESAGVETAINLTELQFVEPAPEPETAGIEQSTLHEEAIEHQAADEIAPPPVYDEPQSEASAEAPGEDQSALPPAASEAESSAGDDETANEDRAGKSADELEEAGEKVGS
ncbi:MAG: HD domain-containing phosphohydrolase [Blastocatellales bacterium]